ncbi:hypothetical protein GCM10007907_19510 [Chitinimonas prasina]|uniref:HD-GYP domain-containing protein n=1 Tax=Chitinimonas prasina TaxID=1434937 RepID=A0ABQ5YDW5_9NEIS|nr:hypothetical protein GCM10007907_19510 [Chitinimonas prasina]
MGNARVRPSDIQIGQALKWDVCDSNGRLLLSKGHVISSDGQLDRLVRVGLYADAEALARTRAEVPAEPIKPPSVTATLAVARKKLDYLVGNVEQVIRQGVFLRGIEEITQHIDAACSHDQNVAMAMVLLRQEGRYATRHMINVATVVRLVARAMKMTKDREGSVVAAALTMNLAMADYQDELKQQAEPLTPTQRARLDRHPLEARELLLRAGVTDPVWLTAVEQHHEHFDGSGYPGRSRCIVEAQLLCLADVFCARIVPCAYRPAVASNVALRGILLERGKAFDPTVAAVFIKTLGIYPPGMLVRLVSGEVGVVLQQGSNAQQPAVATFISPQGTPTSLILRRDTSQDAYAIAAAIDPKSFSAYINMEAIWGATAAAHGPEAHSRAKHAVRVAAALSANAAVEQGCPGLAA